MEATGYLVSFSTMPNAQETCCAIGLVVLNVLKDYGNPWCLIKTVMSGITGLGFVFECPHVHTNTLSNVNRSELICGYNRSYLLLNVI